MDITRRSDYACRILRAAYQGNGQCVSVAEIAEAEDIPYAFARNIQHDLVKRGLVRTVRGTSGGVILNCDPAQITVLDVLEAVQGNISMALCIKDPTSCDKQDHCAYHMVWQGADKLLADYFSAITLEDLFTLREDHPIIKKAIQSCQASEICAAQS